MANISARDRGALLIYSFILRSATQSRQPNRQNLGAAAHRIHPFIPSSFFHGCLAPFFWPEVRSLRLSLSWRQLVAIPYLSTKELKFFWFGINEFARAPPLPLDLRVGYLIHIYLYG